MDTIFIQGLQTQAIIGIYDWEREEPQPLVFDIEMQTDLKKASQSDQIDDTVDYAAVAEEVTALVEKSRVELIETLAEQVIEWIFDQHPAVQGIHLCLSKPQAVPQAETVGLILKRQRSGL